MNIPAEPFSRKFITNRDCRALRTPPCRRMRWRGAAPRGTKLNPMQREDQQHCQINFILTLLQRPNFFFHSIIALLGGPVGYLLPSRPGSPITFVLGPRRVKVMSIPHPAHLLHRMMDSVLLSLKPFDKPKESEEEGEEEMKKDWKLPGGRFGRKTGEERTNRLATGGSSAPLVLGKKLKTSLFIFFGLALGCIQCHVGCL